MGPLHSNQNIKADINFIKTRQLIGMLILLLYVDIYDSSYVTHSVTIPYISVQLIDNNSCFLFFSLFPVELK